MKKIWAKCSQNMLNSGHYNTIYFTKCPPENYQANTLISRYGRACRLLQAGCAAELLQGFLH